MPVLADLHVQRQGNFNFCTALLLAGVLLLVVAKLGFWFEFNGWLVLAIGWLGLALTAAGGYLYATQDPEQQFIAVRAGIDPRPLLTSYLGVVLAGAMFLALGLLVSSWVKSQLVAWMLSLLLGLGFVLPASFVDKAKPTPTAAAATAAPTATQSQGLPISEFSRGAAVAASGGGAKISTCFASSICTGTADSRGRRRPHRSGIEGGGTGHVVPTHPVGTVAGFTPAKP